MITIVDAAIYSMNGAMAYEHTYSDGTKTRAVELPGNIIRSEYMNTKGEWECRQEYVVNHREGTVGAHLCVSCPIVSSTRSYYLDVLPITNHIGEHIMSHTPTPYYVNEDGDICATFSGIEYVIALPVPHPSIGRYNREETAAFIVTACNAHDALINALLAARAALTSPEHEGVLAEIEEALAAAGVV